MTVDVEREYLANVARICPNAFEPTAGYRDVPRGPLGPRVFSPGMVLDFGDCAIGTSIEYLGQWQWQTTPGWRK